MLRYVGDGSWLPGVPARDLSDEEVKEYGGKDFLVRTRLYVAPKMERVQRQDKMERPDVQDKEGE